MYSPRRAENGSPLAPTQDEWDAMSETERADVLDALPGEVPDHEMSPPEGDRHFKAKVRTLDALRGFFARQKRRVYLTAELPVYYPSERRFAPDVLAVLDVEDHDRDRWVVSAEGRGIDWVHEVHVGGDRKKDAEANVERYARLGIPEYFLFDRARGRLFAYQLTKERGRTYQPIVPQAGRYASRVLGLDVQVEDGHLRFYSSNALVLETEEIVARLQGMVDEAHQRAEEEARRAEGEARRAEGEARRADEAVRRADDEARHRAEAEAEIARLREELRRK